MALSFVVLQWKEKKNNTDLQTSLCVCSTVVCVVSQQSLQYSKITCNIYYYNTVKTTCHIYDIFWQLPCGELDHETAHSKTADMP